jgi:hypothetical protein
MNQCAGCRREFSSLSAFDRHQDVSYKRVPAVLCRDPRDAGLSQRKDGRWSLPPGAASRAWCAARAARTPQGVTQYTPGAFSGS